MSILNLTKNVRKFSSREENTGGKEELLITSISPFPAVFPKRLVPQTRKNLVWEGVVLPIYLTIFLILSIHWGKRRIAHYEYFSFSRSVSKRLVPQTRKNLVWEGVVLPIYLTIFLILSYSGFLILFIKTLSLYQLINFYVINGLVDCLC